MICFVFFLYFNIFINVSLIKSERQKLLLVSLDGFRWDFQKKGYTPNLDWIVKHGVTVDYVVNVFPTITYPNHQTIVTGLYPEHHGIIGNAMFNKKTGKLFDMLSEETWNQSTPIWIENQLNGFESGLCYWPGHNILFNGMKANYTADDKYADPYTSPQENKIMPLEKRISLVINWLKKPNVTFVGFYYEEPDETAHKIGVDVETKKELGNIIFKTDKMIGELIKEINKENITVNLIIVGDHGHTTLSYKKVIYLDKYINLDDALSISGTTFVYIFAKTGCLKHIYNGLKAGQDHFKVFLKENIPEELHLKNSDRAPDILVISSHGWTILKSKNSKEWFQETNDYWKIGDHGYEPEFKSMNTVFYAFGPAFKKNYKSQSVRIIDLYSLMCKVLKIPPRKNDGNETMVTQFLNKNT
ncbi:ectonucleotide pyrophosphatase/phosphodiesterase family member 5 [Hydra vulgaris]|uniref:Ectonucleotide pyrophosphatase/phosphodiesterase family member 5 n=1 Tax=Hydra vulgaris TaxID=6087 RepID=A0ABM4CJZ9_HYDVU